MFDFDDLDEAEVGLQASNIFWPLPTSDHELEQFEHADA